MSRTVEEQIIADNEDFDRVVEKLTKEGFWENAKEAWGITTNVISEEELNTKNGNDK